MTDEKPQDLSSLDQELRQQRNLAVFYAITWFVGLFAVVFFLQGIVAEVLKLGCWIGVVVWVVVAIKRMRDLRRLRRTVLTEEQNEDDTQAGGSIRRRVLIIFATALIGMFLFPPVELVNSMSLAKAHAGYRFLFQLKHPDDWGSAVVNVPLLAVQVLALALLGVCAFFGASAAEKKAPKANSPVLATTGKTPVRQIVGAILVCLLPLAAIGALKYMSRASHTASVERPMLHDEVRAGALDGAKREQGSPGVAPSSGIATAGVNKDETATPQSELPVVVSARTLEGQSARFALPPSASFARAAQDLRERLTTDGMLGVIADLSRCYSIAEALEGHERHKTKLRECVTQDAVAFVFDRVGRQTRMPEHAYLADSEFIKRFTAYLSSNEVEQAVAQETLDDFRRLAEEAIGVRR